MNFSLTEEQDIAVDSFARFLQAEIKPIVDQYRGEKIPKKAMQKALKLLLPYGMGNGLVAEKFGGYGFDEVTIGLLFEQLAMVSPDISVMILIQMEVGMLLANAPTQIRDSHLAPLLEGDLIGCIGISEPDVGSNISEIKTHAKQDGEDWLISGEKCWISNGHYSDFIVVVSKGENGAASGLALFVVDRDMGYTSANIEKMGLNGQSTAQVFFDQVRVPAERMIAPPGQGLKTMLTLLQGSRPLVGLMAVAVAQCALNESISYAQERKQFGKVIAANQLIQARIADMSIRIEASRLLLYKALDHVHRGLRSDLQAAQAKLFATEAAVEVTRHALAIHGGNGITLEFPVQDLYRIAPILTVTEGTAEMQKLIIGRILLGVAAF
jgi:alkylation response protein AidB-like acyl-CoA dehydrogenase